MIIANIFFSVYNVPGTGLSAFCIFMHFIIHINLLVFPFYRFRNWETKETKEAKELPKVTGLVYGLV